MPGCTIYKQCWQFVLNLLEYFQREKENNGSLCPLTSVQKRVADSLKISLRCVSRINNEQKIGVSLTTPGQIHRVPKNKSEDMHDSIKAKVRNVIYSMKENGRHMTLKILNEELKAKGIIDIFKASLRRLLKTSGFKYNRVPKYH